MRIELLYFAGCPNWRLTQLRLTQVLAQLGREDAVDLIEVRTDQEAAALGFTGSPTVLIDGVDPFPRHGVPSGLACRLYPTPAALGGAPTLDQLHRVLAGVASGTTATGSNRGQARTGE